MAINITIDGIRTVAEQGETILDVAKKLGKEIPTLCHIQKLKPAGACRVCVVDVNGKLLPSCSTPVYEGMEIKTNTVKVINARRDIIEMYLAAHPNNCTTCFRAGDCTLSELSTMYAIDRITIPQGYERRHQDSANPAIVREPEKCILCGKCVRVCNEIQEVGAIDFANRGADTIVATPFNSALNSTQCTFCGQCIIACPTGALHENPHLSKVIAALSDPKKYVVVQTAPAVRVAIGEEFGMEPGTIVTGKMAAALKAIGFDLVVDTNFGADLTIMEEGSELLHRIKNSGTLPLLTSCSPGWVKFMEHKYPDLIPNLSSAKSPHEMLGAVIKHIGNDDKNIDPKDIYVVSVMPCVAKKYEAERPELGQGMIKDVDAVLTTREAAMLMKQMGIDLKHMPEEEFDAPFGESTGAAAIFGRSGGVMEAALRTAYYLITGEELDVIEFNQLGGEGIREAEITIEGKKLRVATVSGLSAAKRMMDKIRAGEEYHFIEIMACPGGCINGGGQPYPKKDSINLRTAALNTIDRGLAVRKSHKNQSILNLYRDHLEKPLSEKAHHLLHTHYYERGKFGS